MGIIVNTVNISTGAPLGCSQSINNPIKPVGPLRKLGNNAN